MEGAWARLISIKAHISNVALHHTIFDLPFAFMGAVLASSGHPSPWVLLWVAVALTAARAAALAIDNLADLKFDKQQARMAHRAMVTGAISKSEARIFIAVCLIVTVAAVAQLPRICLYLLPIAAVPFIIYPFMKRITCWVHMFLGAAIAMAPAGGYVAAAEEITLPMVTLCVAVALWMAGFDAIYGSQDEAFDRAHGLHSLSVTFGARGAFYISYVMHVLCIAAFFAVGILLSLGSIYFIGVGIAAGTLYYQHKIVSPTDLSRVTQRYFMRNGIVSVAIFACTWVSYFF